MENRFVKGELAWPATKCEACDYDLREATVKASEKSNDEKGSLKWTGFCPNCGHGMFVGDRSLPIPTAEVLAEREAQAILKNKANETGLSASDPEHLVTPGTAEAIEPSLVPPDRRGEALAEEQDPEHLLEQEPTGQGEAAQGKPEPGAIRPPGEGEYFCTKDAKNHREDSKIGKSHLKYRE